MSVIISRIINSETDKKVALVSDQFSRLISIGTSWTRLRIGMRLAVNGTVTTGETLFRFGLCSGTTNMVGSTSTTNFIGISGAGVSGAALTYNATYNAYDFGQYLFWGMKRVGTTSTDLGAVTLSGYYGGLATINKRSVIVLDITKGSPNYVMAGLNHHNSQNVYNAADVSLPKFIACLEAYDLYTASVSVLGTGYTYTGNLTAACDETAGSFNAINIQWSSPTPLEISDLAYLRMN